MELIFEIFIVILIVGAGLASMVYVIVSITKDVTPHDPGYEAFLRESSAKSEIRDVAQDARSRMREILREEMKRRHEL